VGRKKDARGFGGALFTPVLDFLPAGFPAFPSFPAHPAFPPFLPILPFPLFFSPTFETSPENPTPPR